MISHTTRHAVPSAELNSAPPRPGSVSPKRLRPVKPPHPGFAGKMSEGQQSQAERPETAAVLDPDMGLDGLDGLDDAGWPWQADMISAGFWFEDGFLNHHLPDQLPVLLTPGAGNRNPATVPNQESRQEAFFLLNLVRCHILSLERNHCLM